MRTLLLCPTYNRIDTTVRFIEALASQRVESTVSLMVVDASSPDGTAQRVSSIRPTGALEGIQVLSVPRRYLWARAMNVAMNEAARQLDARDAVILINDDVYPEQESIAILLEDHLGNDRAIVTATRSPEEPGGGRLRIERGHYGLLDADVSATTSHVVPISVAPGRFTVVPASLILEGERLHCRLFPHHFADLDFTGRMRAKGTKCLLSKRARFSDTTPPSSAAWSASARRRYFSRKSPDRAVSAVAFWARHAGVTAICSRFLGPQGRNR